MPRISLDLRISRPRWRWYASGAMVIIGALVLFAYIMFIQASAAFAENGASLEAFQLSLLERIIKSLMLALTMGLFLFFFIVQDYRMTFNNLLERLSFRDNPPVPPLVSPDDSPSDSSPDFSSVPRDNHACNVFAGFGSQTDETDRAGVEVPALYNDELVLIESSVESVLNENQTFRTRLDEQRRELHDDFLLRMMKGWVHDTPVARRICSSFNLRLLDSDYLVVMTGVSPGEDCAALTEEALSSAYLRMKRLLKQMLSQFLEVHAISIDGRLACFILAEEADEDLRDRQTLSDLTCAIKLSQQLVFDETRISLQSAFGSVERGFEGIASTFKQASNNYEFAQLTGDDCAVVPAREGGGYAESEQLDSSWPGLERRISNCIDAEEYDEAERLFMEVADSGFVCRASSLALAQHRLLNLSTLLLKAMERSDSYSELPAADQQGAREKVLACPSLTELKRTATNIFTKLSFQTLAKRKQSNYARIMEVIDYIDAHYYDENLSVNQIANDFSLNPSFLSRNFKKLMCIGLADYIKRTRIHKAKELMSDSSVSVKQAAELVGFGNTLTMNRAFRKLEGTTAGRMRKVSPEDEEE